MEPIFHIDPQLDIPLYRQLVDMIHSAVKRGQLVTGQKLPTVQELSQTLSIARGTIKRAYDELERQGILEKVQGRGTFVCYEPPDTASRKAQAMEAIDTMLNRLEEMGFSPAEINIFLNLKLRQRAEQESCVKVAVVESAPELLDRMAAQLRRIEGVEVYVHLLESLRQYPFKLGDDFDLLVTTPEHLEYLRRIVPGKKSVITVALSPDSRCLIRIARLDPGARVGILCRSPEYARWMEAVCREYAPEVHLAPAQICAADTQPELRDLDAVLIPEDLEAYVSREQQAALESFPGQLICCGCGMDEGSVIYLENKIKRLLDAKAI